MNQFDLDQLLRPLQHKDLRALCRARGLNPGGSKDQLAVALKENMMATGNYSMVIPSGGEDGGGYGGSPGGGYGMGGPPQSSDPYGGYGGGGGPHNVTGVTSNNYSRPGGQQNVGNFITDKPSSRVLAPPGGGSTLQLGGYGGEPAGGQYGRGRSRESPQQYNGGGGGDYGYSGTANIGSNNNNYSRPGGQQNVGNFITDKPSSRVLAPPGGSSSITFGNYVPPHQQQQQPSRPPLPPRNDSMGAGGATYGGGGGGMISASYGAPPGMPPSGGPPPGYYSTNSGPMMYPPGLQDKPPGLGSIPVPMGYDSSFSAVHTHLASGTPPPGVRIPSAGRRAGKPPSGGGMAGVMDGAQYGDGGAVGTGRGNDYTTNNYSRPGGQQNVGNFITSRPSSRVLAPPGGRSQISFG